MFRNMFRKQFPKVQDAWTLAHAIVDTVREPLIVLDQDLRVVAASRSFYLTFKVNADDTQGKLLYDLGDGQWDIPKLRLLLGKILPEQGAMEDYEVEHDFPSIGQRTMLLNARKVFSEKGSHSTILLGIEDVTQKRTLENEKDDLIRQKEMLAGGVGTSCSQQLANHRQHNHAEGKSSRVGRNPPSPRRRSQPGHLGCHRSKAPPRLCRQLDYRNGAVSCDALHGSGAIDDW